MAHFSLKGNEMTTDRTNKEAERILQEFGPNNNVRFAAMADFAKSLEKENAELLNQIKTLTSPVSLHFDKLMIKAFWDGHWNGRNNQAADNNYKTQGLNSKLVSAYDNGFHSGQAERQTLD